MYRLHIFEIIQKIMKVPVLVARKITIFYGPCRIPTDENTSGIETFSIYNIATRMRYFFYELTTLPCLNTRFSRFYESLLNKRNLYFIVFLSLHLRVKY